MTDLHFALAGLALVVLIGLYAFGKWREQRALRERGEGDGSAVGTRREPAPGRDPLAAAGAPPAAGPGARIEPRLGPQPAVTTDAVAAAPSSRGTIAADDWTEDPLLDYVLELRCAHAVDGVAVIDAAVALAHAELPLPFMLVVWDARSQQWMRPDRFGFYSELLVAIQLAHRRHRLDEVEVARFLATVEQMAIALEADVESPGTERVLAAARELDELCVRFDVALGLTLESSVGAWDPTRLADAMAQARLQPAGSLRWVRTDEKHRVLFQVTSASLLADRLLLELDVPLAPAGEQPFQLLANTANQLAAALGGRVIDDHKRVIDAAAIAAIDQQLVGLYAEMAAAGIEPGSQRAFRLYG